MIDHVQSCQLNQIKMGKTFDLLQDMQTFLTHYSVNHCFSNFPCFLLLNVTSCRVLLTSPNFDVIVMCSLLLYFCIYDHTWLIYMYNFVLKDIQQINVLLLLLPYSKNNVLENPNHIIICGGAQMAKMSKGFPLTARCLSRLRIADGVCEKVASDLRLSGGFLLHHLQHAGYKLA